MYLLMKLSWVFSGQNLKENLPIRNIFKLTVLFQTLAKVVITLEKKNHITFCISVSYS